VARALVFACVAALLACDPETTPTDAGVDAGSDAGPPVDGGPPELPPPPVAEPGRHDVTIVETRRVVDSPGLPAETPILHSNNNLDVIRHEGRVYLAWRTAPDHYAGPDTVIHVVSSDDEVTWTHEASYTIGTDLREPRFLSLGTSLFLYVSVLGADSLAFTPMGVRVTERRADGTWTPLEDVPGLGGYIAWRTRTERGVPYMTAYLGGEYIYLFDGLPLHSDLLSTTDGRTWAPVDPTRRTVYTGGGSETDFAIADDGTLYGVIRNEAGDANGWGMMICSAPAGDLANWDCHVDPKKYDSPLMFWHDGEVYLVGRRNVTETGNYDLMTGRGSIQTQTAANQIPYTQSPKRCSLWRYVQGEDRIAYVMDLPSGGDTCFPAWMEGETPEEIILYNYSCDIDDPATPYLAWNEGQVGRTYIYRHVLRFTPR
jgi:hypothetical protein